MAWSSSTFYPRVGYTFEYGDGTSQMEYEEVYRDVNSMSVRTRHQDKEINRLKDELKEKKIERTKKLENLIAYYYKR